MTVIRWTLTDPATSESWTMPINPNAMTSPQTAKTLRHAYGIRRGVDRVRTFKTPNPAVQWEWSGVIRSKEHYDDYVYWASKTGEVHVTDHLGRTWEVFMASFEPEDRQPMANVPWRLRYKVRALLIGRVTS
jgi:hypothetical protein